MCKSFLILWGSGDMGEGGSELNRRGSWGEGGEGEREDGFELGLELGARALGLAGD